MDPIVAGIATLTAALLVVAAAAAFGPRLRIPAPLVLVVLGVLLSLLPIAVPTVPPELVLSGILPPLLYASSVSMPSMDLRREFGTISGLSVLLVLVSALLLGWCFTLLIPGLPYAWGVALGAVVSPTDSVATSIVKGAKVSHRVTAILEGEGLLNDASALVLLRAAIAAGGVGAAAISVPVVFGQFAWSLVVAVVLGIVVGRVTLLLRARVTDSTVNTVISFAVPFLASIPAELLHASGLVAAVAAGLAVGRNSPRKLSAQHRRSDSENWSTVSLLLEGAIFLLMGFQISGFLSAAGGPSAGLRVLPIALAGLAGVVVVRALFVTPLLLLLKRETTRKTKFRARLEDMQLTIAEGGRPALEARRQDHQQQRRVEGRPDRAGGGDRGPRGGGRRPLRPITQQDFERFSKRIRQALADVDYLAASPLGAREGAVVVWAGMRGAVTVAAAQTIPEDAPQHDTLILVAFGVAAISLLVQGGTLSLLIRVLKPKGDDLEARKAEQEKVLQLIRDSAGVQPPREPAEQERAVGFDERLAQLRTSRNALLDARDEGVFSADVLGGALDSLDAMELAMDVRRNAQS